uniref:Uncharacterized protein n=1 Tax=Rhizophora mucronata TaxID=61149 RepID=A0A2P2PRB6_RHIMU
MVVASMYGLFSFIICEQQLDYNSWAQNDVRKKRIKLKYLLLLSR